MTCQSVGAPLRLIFGQYNLNKIRVFQKSALLRHNLFQTIPCNVSPEKIVFHITSRLPSSFSRKFQITLLSFEDAKSTLLTRPVPRAAEREMSSTSPAPIKLSNLDSCKKLMGVSGWTAICFFSPLPPLSSTWT